MSEKEIRQGVRVETVRDKCLCDGRANDFSFICFLLPLIVVLIVVMGNKGATSGIYLLGVFWVASVFWFLLKRLRTYSFLARDGLYIVRQGWAVLISWKMIESVQPMYHGIGRGGVMGYRIHYCEDLVDLVTETRFVLDLKRDYIFPPSKQAKKIFYRYAKII